MNPENQQYTSDVVTDTDLPRIEVKVEEAGVLATVNSSDGNGMGDQWQQIRDQVVQIISELPNYVGGFFAANQRPILSIGLIVATLVTIKVTLAVLDAVNDIPLLAPTFELIGLGYTAWFVNRFLLRAANRQELSSEVKNLKDQVLGSN
ncbi:CAAD domain-containing protein [Microcoleus sp. FACHB-672]|uniref:CAAD domain-containing protein n=1 Tax=Microcoleus sp. FACHB-672 TaxID=2692825 RepID=UPI001688A459|nr:CAAD domain-containing protein [Microcoleus sp. FACHB-672]MBD2042855.1 CAAD domain-containing protein [Microcoleus sp. FACHB-672]